jgi:hypothetical protein
MKEVTSLHLVGTILQDGQYIDVDLATAESGNCEGTMSVEGQGSFKVRVTGGDGFFKPDEQFWRTQAGPRADAIIDMVGDKWVAATGQMSPATAACDWDEFTSNFDQEEDLTDVTGTDEVDGEKTVTVTFKSDEDNPGVANVMAGDPHYIAKMEVEEEGHLTFSEFNQPVEPDAPTAVIDLADLSHRQASTA